MIIPAKPTAKPKNSLNIAPNGRANNTPRELGASKAVIGVGSGTILAGTITHAIETTSSIMIS